MTQLANANTSARRLRALMRDHCVGLPGAFNGHIARIAAREGFEGLYVSGAAVTASAGVPDIGLLSLTEFCGVIQQVCAASGLPVIADADTGFGEVEMCSRAAYEYARAGAAGMHIEDQVFPKRCGHLDGKTLIPTDHMQEKVAAAARARDGLGGEFIVCARTDAAGVDGMDSAIERARAYVDAGADMLFPEGLHSEAEFGRFAEALRGYGPRGGAFLLANMTEFGKTPMLRLGRFGELGYHCVIWPVSTFRVAMGAVTGFLRDLKREGTAEGWLDRMQQRKDLYAAIGYTPGEEWTYPSQSAGGSAGG